MLIAPELRDIRDERKWHKHWRDPPGMGWFWCCCSTCVNCSTTRFTDNFTNNLAGYTKTVCGTETGVVNFSAAGGNLSESQTGTYSGPNPVYTQGITVPALNGLCISICVIVKISGGASLGVTIGSMGQAFYRTPFANNLGSWGGGGGATGVNGCLNGAGTFNNFGGSLSLPGTLTLAVVDTSSGAGTYAMKTYWNGTLMENRTALALTFTAGGTIQVGVVGDPIGSTWAAPLIIATS